MYPSLIATMLFIFSLLLTSIGIVREKEIGTIEQVMVTPIRRIEFILGKTIPYMITGYISMTFMLLVAFWSSTSMSAGSLPLLYLPHRDLSRRQHGDRPDHQRQRPHPAAGPAHQFSGAHALGHAQRLSVSGHQHARSGQFATIFNPMRWYLEILRGIVMKDVGILATLWPATLA
jgi:ABC-2 type transport system permease protein